MNKEECKHEFRQFMENKYHIVEDKEILYLDNEGYYCIHCLKRVEKEE